MIHLGRMPVHPTLDEWIARDAIPFALDTPASLDAATDRVIAELGPEVELLALGEALHGSQEILLIRNRMFQRLVEQHGYSAVVLEVSWPQARAINACGSCWSSGCGPIRRSKRGSPTGSGCSRPIASWWS